MGGKGAVGGWRCWMTISCEAAADSTRRAVARACCSLPRPHKPKPLARHKCLKCLSPPPQTTRRQTWSMSENGPLDVEWVAACGATLELWRTRVSLPRARQPTGVAVAADCRHRDAAQAPSDTAPWAQPSGVDLSLTHAAESTSTSSVGDRRATLAQQSDWRPGGLADCRGARLQGGRWD
jgi:hypothetical protein